MPDTKFQIKEATEDAEFKVCWPVIHDLHPHIKSLDEMLARLELQRAEGYRILYCTEAGNEKKVISYLGFRIQNVFFTGKTLHIADLGTLKQERGNGAAGALVDAIVEYALKNECDHVCLDSTYARTSAHRLYLSKGFAMNAHHFVLQFWIKLQELLAINAQLSFIVHYYVISEK